MTCKLSTTVLALTLFTLVGCSSHYVVPAGGVSAAQMTGGDLTVAYNQQPMARFPARIAFVRVQAPDYHTSSTESYGNGRYSVVTVREIEEGADMEAMAKWPGIAGVGGLNRLVIPSQLNTDKELRQAASRLQADMLLIYSVDTTFRVNEHEIGPLGIITLGTMPNHEARVTSTCSAAIFDVRSGYLYALTEATAQSSELASAWRTEKAIDNSRVKAERESFKKLLPELEKTWTDVVRQYAVAPSFSVR
jgi:hypothetical protein